MIRLSIYWFFILVVTSLWVACKPPVRTPIPPTLTVTTVHAVTSTVSSMITPTLIPLPPKLSPLEYYQGSNPYREYPGFELAYDSSLWSLIGDEGTNLGKRLVHKRIADCYLRLESGPMGAPYVASTSLAGREWTILQIQPKILQYFFTVDDIAFIFDFVLPKEYSPTIKSVCQTQAEEVINTFQIIEKKQ